MLTKENPYDLVKIQLRYMRAQGGFLDTILKLIGPVVKAIAPVTKVVGPAMAMDALSGEGSYGANKLLRKAVGGKGFNLKPYGKGFRLKPYTGLITIKLTPREINGLIKKKKGDLSLCWHQ